MGDNGWQQSAGAWIADLGEQGDFARRYVLDPVMLALALKGSPQKALDIGCGEGRFCRMLQAQGIETVGVEPTPALLDAAMERNPQGVYIDASAEHLPFEDASFDLVVSYLSLIDIPDIRAAIPEMARVLRPGGALVIANLNSFNTAGGDRGWVKDPTGRKLHFPIDDYLVERAIWVDYRGIRVRNHHRPLSTYMRLLLDAGLQLRFFDEPAPIDGAPLERADGYRRVPWFVVMEWLKPRSH